MGGAAMGGAALGGAATGGAPGATPGGEMGPGAPGPPTAMVSIIPGDGWTGGAPGVSGAGRGTTALGPFPMGPATLGPFPMGPATDLAREGGPLGMEVIRDDGPPTGAEGVAGVYAGWAAAGGE